MRPFKHVARQSFSGAPLRYQNILGIDLARFRAPWGEVPIVATTEAQRITLYYWDDTGPRWDQFERAHDPLTFEGDTPDAPLGWNWSDRVAVACSATTVHVVYKRQELQESGLQLGLFLDRYEPEDTTPGSASANHQLRLLDTRTLVQANLGGSDIGRSLWAGSDPRSGDLLVLYQSRRATQLDPNPDWQLTLLRVRIDANGQVSSTSTNVGRGGFDLDARLAGTVLLAVYRRTPEALRLPLGSLLAGGQHLTSGADADPFYEPLQLATIDTATGATTTEPIPGGEHPQIQREAPLLITMDRPSRLDLVLDTPIIPLPPRRPRAIWGDGRVDKVAWLRDGAETFRGTLLTSDERVIPQSHAAMSEATHLFDLQGGLIQHAAPFRNFPVYVLEMARAEKELTLDVLHHRDFIGLFRTRLRATLSDGLLTVNESAFEVWDIGHAQIGDPEALRPSADGETAQFGPFEEHTLTRSQAAAVRPARADNTMGGNLAADTTSTPVGFFAYTDLGDGCLRVIFAPDIPALGELPPVDNEKVLRPEQVTGPHLRCDEWIELQASDFTNSGLIGYSVGLFKTNRSLGSALEVPIDFLIDACEIVTGEGSGPDGAPLDPVSGLSRAQLAAVDAFRARLVPPLVTAMTTGDGRDVTVTVTPGGFVAGGAVTLAADVAGAAPAVFWTLTPLGALSLPVPGPLLPGMPGVLPGMQQVATGNPVAIHLPFAGAWRLSVFLPGGGVAAGAATDIAVQTSVYAMVTSLYDGVAEGDLYRIGDLDLTALQYDMRYGVADSGPPSRITIAPRDSRATEMRFVGNGLGQGVVESRAILSLATDELKLKLGLDLLFEVKDFGLSLRYGRPFTPGMLMSDRRSRDVLDGRRLGDDAVDTVGRREPARHAGIGAKPFGHASTPEHQMIIDVGMTLGGIAIPALLGALALMGAFAVAETIAGLVGAIAVATALGPAGLVAALVAAIALAIFIAVAVPPLVEDFIAERVSEQFTSGQILENLNDQPVIRYAGEGAAEAIARKALARARELGFNVPAPAGLDTEEAGLDRFHGQLFQMVFVSDGVCRVLIRLDDCRDEVELPPTPDTPGEDDDSLPGLTSSAARNRG